MRRLAVTLLPVPLLMLLLLPAAAGAQVYEDDGPAGKEYAIPLDDARSKDGTSKSKDGKDGSGARFGEGISADDGPSGGSGATSAKAKEDTPRSSAPSSKDSGEDSESVAAVPAGSGGSGGSGGSEADSSAALLTGGIALAVLLIGAAVALMARRTATDDI